MLTAAELPVESPGTADADVSALVLVKAVLSVVSNVVV